MEERQARNRIRNLYFLITWGGIVSFIIVLLWKNADAANWLVMEHNYMWQFSDFFRQIIYPELFTNTR